MGLGPTGEKLFQAQKVGGFNNNFHPGRGELEVIPLALWGGQLPTHPLQITPQEKIPN